MTRPANKRRTKLPSALINAPFVRTLVALMTIDVMSNPNCPDEVLMTYKDIAPPRAVVRVRLYRDTDAGEWYDVTGWRADGADCPALAQKIEDSGQGTAFAVFGGDGGVRFRPTDRPGPWNIQDSDQFGEAYVVLMDEADVAYA